MPDNKNVFSAGGWGRAQYHLLRPVWCCAAHAPAERLSLLDAAPIKQQALGRAGQCHCGFPRVRFETGFTQVSCCWESNEVWSHLKGLFFHWKRTCFCSQLPVLSHPVVKEGNPLGGHHGARSPCSWEHPPASLLRPGPALSQVGGGAAL